MLVAEILKDKGSQVYTCSPDITVSAATALLRERRVGAAVVVIGEQVVGMFSERDLVRAIAADGAEALERPIERYMTTNVIFAKPQDTVEEMMERMTDRRIRHFPVCEAQQLVGIVSIGDVVKTRIAETVYEAETLKTYILHG